MMDEDITRKTDQVLAIAEHGEIDTNSIVSLLAISRNHAANILNGLTTNHGHLKRTATNLSHGGIYYKYNITNSGKQRLKWLRDNGRL